MTSSIGKYRIDSTIGQGAMGVVYKAFDPQIERTVAIKTIRKELLAPDPDGAESLLSRFKREAKAAGQLNHPNIVTIYEYGEAAGTVFLAMEHVVGQTLKGLLQEEAPLTSATVADITLQLLDALAYSHRRGVIHRDIKPDNIFVKDDGQIKILDFGLARLDASDLTQFGTVMGTPTYMSPEQFSSGDVDARTDLYAAGIILYQLVTGVKPFQGDSIPAIMYQVVNSAPPDPTALNSNLPTATAAILAKATAKDPAERYQSAEEFAAAIRTADPEHGFAPPRPATTATAEATVIIPGPVASPARPTASRRWPLLLILLGLAVGAAVILFFVFGRHEQPAPSPTANVAEPTAVPSSAPESPPASRPTSATTAAPAQTKAATPAPPVIPSPAAPQETVPSPPAAAVKPVLPLTVKPAKMDFPAQAPAQESPPKGDSDQRGVGGRMLRDNEW